MLIASNYSISEASGVAGFHVYFWVLRGETESKKCWRWRVDRGVEVVGIGGISGTTREHGNSRVIIVI